MTTETAPTVAATTTFQPLCFLLSTVRSFFFFFFWTRNAGPRSGSRQRHHSTAVRITVIISATMTKLNEFCEEKRQKWLAKLSSNYCACHPHPLGTQRDFHVSALCVEYTSPLPFDDTIRRHRRYQATIDATTRRHPGHHRRHRSHHHRRCLTDSYSRQDHPFPAQDQLSWPTFLQPLYRAHFLADLSWRQDEFAVWPSVHQRWSSCRCHSHSLHCCHHPTRSRPIHNSVDELRRRDLHCLQNSPNPLSAL